VTAAAHLATCTGLTATWCPVHGQCICRQGDDRNAALDRWDCPLHGLTSDHGEREAAS
jgi:hypothetical protein